MRLHCILLYNTSVHVCMFPLHLHTYIRMYNFIIRTCVFMQKEESDTQAACTRPLLRMEIKEGVSGHSEKVNYIH